MAETETTRLESVLAGIRGYLTDQLGALDLELHTAKQAVLEMSQELASMQESVQSLVVSRDLLVSKLAELDGTAGDSGTVARARRSRKAAGDAVTQEITALVQGDAVVGALPDSGTADEPPVPAPASGKKRLRTEGEVVGYLRATPGVHKVAEIAAAVSGSGAQAAVVQGIRRALAALVQAGQVERSAQSGTAFYSAAADAPVAAPAVKAKATRKKAAPRAAKKGVSSQAKAVPVSDDASSGAVPTVAGTSIPAARNAKSSPKKSAAEKAVTKKAARKATAPAAPSLESAAPAPAEKAVRADRAKIVAALLAAAQPQSAAEVSRIVMGSQWKTSDATNFRNVLKSLAKEGTVAVVEGENSRSHYTAVPAS